MIPLGIPSFPCPARPPIPRISPFFTVIEKSLTVSPGILTQRCSTVITSSPSSFLSLSSLFSSFTSRPTMAFVISPMEVLFLSRFEIMRPSLITRTLSDTSMISWRRWVMKIMAMPLSASFLRVFRRVSASLSVRTAVGSSRMRSFIPLRLSSRDISVNCLWPTGIWDTSIFSSRLTPSLLMASRAVFCISFRSRVSSLSPKIRLNTLVFFLASLLSTTFSVVVKSGSRENS